VAKSHKFLVAVALLAGGYGLALVWNATANFFWQNDGATSAVDNRAASSLGPTAAVAPAPTIGVQLVPASSVDQAAKLNPPVSATTNSDTTNPASISSVAQSPTWLTAAPQTSVVSVATNSSAEVGQRPSDGDYSNVAAKGLPAGANVERDISTVTPFPTAQITAVKPVDDSASADASPWDRWPRWEPAPTAAPSVAPAVDVVAASTPANRVAPRADQQLAAPATNQFAIQASFSAAAPSANLLQPSNRLLPVSQPIADGNDEDPEPRTHTIIDGDSLAKLAERFLGDSQLGDRIYQLNRDVLSSPELLPIGAELKLPPRPVAATKRAAPMPVAASAASANPPSLVPVEDVCKAFVGMPRAQLLRPLPPVDALQPTATPAAYATTGH
jgi:nucleoid-associated protein YgaU